MNTPSNILIYALGGGWGHVTRSAALAHALGAIARVRILTNSPYAAIVQAASPELPIEFVTTRESAAARVADENPDVLVVDTFPRGLGGELADLLPSLRSRKVLIHRVLNSEYLVWANLREFVVAHYDCIICPGERGELANLPQAVFTEPWLIREPKNTGARADVIVCASGNEAEMPWYGETAALLSRHCDLRCLAPELPPGCPPGIWIRHWPSIDWIANAKVVVGGAGYNTVHECLALGVPLIARAWPRMYDRQLWRAERHPSITIVETPQQACDAALAALREPRPAMRAGETACPTTRLTTAFRNGALEAARLIQSLANSR